MQKLHSDFGVLETGQVKLRRLPWVKQHLFINMTNVLRLCTHMLFGANGKSNGEMSILGRVNEGLTIDDLRKKHGESYTLMKMMNGMRYAYAMATAGSRIDVMRERALQME